MLDNKKMMRLFNKINNHKTMNKGMAPIIALLIAIVILGGGIGGYVYFKNKPVVCPTDTKQCPDGSYVSRVPPKCEFQECPVVASTTTPISTTGITSTPTSTADTAGWKTYRDENLGFEIKYPSGTEIFYPFEGASNPNISPSSTIEFYFPLTRGNTKLTTKVLTIDINDKNSCDSYHDPLISPSVMIGGMSFKKYDVSGAHGGTETRAIATEYCTMKDNKPFRLTTELEYFEYSEKPFFDIEKESEIFTQVLSTFKFLK